MNRSWREESMNEGCELRSCRGTRKASDDVLKRESVAYGAIEDDLLGEVVVRFIAVKRCDPSWVPDAVCTEPVVFGGRVKHPSVSIRVDYVGGELVALVNVGCSVGERPIASLVGD